MEKADPELIYLAATSASADSPIINLTRVRMVTQIKPDHCVLWFSENHKVPVNGPAAAQVLSILGRKTVMPDGQPFVLPEKTIAAPKQVA